MSLDLCKYCGKPKNMQTHPAMQCDTCKYFVHLTCLRRPGTPGDITGDVFFTYTCVECSPDGFEVMARQRLSWAVVITLTIHHLTAQSYGISNHGFFHYKTHICSFIDRNWSVLFGQQLKQKKNWIGTIAGALSNYNNIFFQSGSLTLNEAGWWTLLHKFSPCLAANILQEMTNFKSKCRGKRGDSAEGDLFLQKVTELGYRHLLNDGPQQVLVPPEPVPVKKQRVNSGDYNVQYTTEYYDSDSRNESTTTDTYFAEDDSEDMNVSRDTFMENYSEATRARIPPSDSSSTHSFQPSIANYDSDSRSRSPIFTLAEPSDDSEDNKPLTKTEYIPRSYNKTDTDSKRIKIEELSRHTLFSSQPNSLNDMPWVTKVPAKSEQKNIVPLTEYEEVHLLKKVEVLIAKVADPKWPKLAELRRLRAKLAVRRLKRHKHLPLFHIDNAVKNLSGISTNDSRSESSNMRVLDRFQTAYLMDNLCGTVASTAFVNPLVGHIEPTTFHSPYSGTLLKPFIRRDMETKPLWLNVMDELLLKTHKMDPSYALPERAPLCYSYVKPQHIPAVNNLCSVFFWPGVDLSETLQYPEFSCVVTYEKLVVGFAFLVPDVGYNEAYISFICTRPEWRNAKIATFMLYHLLQTCTGKDVTLHVSPTNSAIFLYQKFGFKVEELVQDFYEKYYDVDSKTCKHALFLRLVR